MSGPKLSAAEIERMRQERLERERLERLRILREARKIYGEACNKIAATKRYASNLLGQIPPLYVNDAKCEVEAILSELIVREVENDKEPEDYHNMAAVMNKDVERITASLDLCLEKYFSRIRVEQKLTKADSMHQAYQSFLNVRTDPVDVTSIDFRSHYEHQKLLDKIKQIYTHYIWLAVHGETEADRQFGSECAENTQKRILDKWDTIEDEIARSYVQAMINEEADIRRRECEKRNLYDDYAALAVLMDVIPKPPSDFPDTEALKEIIADFNCRLRQKNEMDYIADQINEAMVSLGYGFVTSRVLTRKDRTEMDCSLYQADDRTGIAVYTDQSGAVMMRMTVLGSDTDITDDDRLFSLERQIDFCAGHADIVDALAERGVYLKQKSYLEPDKKYTYKVNVNTAGTKVQTDADGRVILRKDIVDRRKRRRAKGKKMRSMQYTK